MTFEIPDTGKRIPKQFLWLISGFSLAKVLIHFAANSNYGLHADELYYIALSKHLQWGYLDTSPLIVFAARFSSFLFGDSTFAYRIIPTLVSAGNVFLTGLLTYRLGGKKLGISIACMAMLCSPVLLATGYFLQPVALEHFFWTALAYCLIRYVQTQRAVFLYLFAIFLGLGVLNKYTILMYAFALFTGVLCTTAARRKFSIRDILPAIITGVIIVSPNLIWQIRNDFPALNYFSIVRDHTAFKGTGDYLFQYVFFHGAGMAIWIAGLSFLVLSPAHRGLRFPAWAFLISTAILLILHGKIYYGIGAFPVLFAAGGVCWEKMLQNVANFWRYNVFAMLILPVIIALPIVLPVFPFPVTLWYFRQMTTYTNITQPLRWEDGKTHQLSQFYADMFGWEELTGKVRTASLLLPPDKRKHAVVLTESYAVAGAVVFYGNEGIPMVISPTNSFILWSPPALFDADVIYISRKPLSEIRRLAERATLTGTVTSEFAHEKGTGIYLLHKPGVELRLRYARLRSQFIK